MTLEEAIEKVGENWQTGIKGYFTADEICDLNDMLLELQDRREQADKELEEEALEIERDDWEREE